MSALRILLVDDDPTIRESLGSWLSRVGLPATIAEDATSGTAALDRADYDVLLSDVHLEGNQQLRWTNAVLARPNPPAIVLMTGNPELESAMRAANLPVAAYLVKPVNLETLRKLLDQFQKRRECQRELAELSGVLSALLAEQSPAGADCPPGVREQLKRIAQALADHAATHRRIGDREAPWRNLIEDTIGVLEKTKHSFRSKDLGELRKRLHSALAKTV